MTFCSDGVGGPTAGAASTGGSGRGFLEALEELREWHLLELNALRVENEELRAKVKSLEADGGTKPVPFNPNTLEELTLDDREVEVPTASRGIKESSHGDSDGVVDQPEKRVSGIHKLRRSVTGVLLSMATPKDDVLPFEQAEDTSSERGSPLEWVEQLIHQPWFELLFGALIFLNALVMAAEAQHSGLILGVEIEHPSVQKLEVAKLWPGAYLVFKMLGWFFGIAFLGEIVLKLVGLRIKFMYSTWNWIDLTIVVLWIVSIVGTSLPMDPSIIRLARLARLIRLLRLAQTIHAFDKLHLISSALGSSISILAWTCVLFFIIQLVIALFLTSLLTELHLSDADQPLDGRQRVFKLFGTFSRSMFSVFEITLGNWPPISRELAETVSEWFMLFGVLHKLTLGFAFVGVVNGIFMQETFKVAATNDAIMVRNRQRTVTTHAKKMKMFFKLADTSGDGSIDRSEFKEMLAKPSVSTWLAAMELDETDHDLLFSLVDDNSDGMLTLQELVKGVARLRGSARSVDLALVMRQLDDIKARLDHRHTFRARNSVAREGVSDF